jgi:CheY-like chemotaxis protein
VSLSGFATLPHGFEDLPVNLFLEKTGAIDRFEVTFSNGCANRRFLNLGDPATAHIPVVALSANAMPRDIAMGLESGFFRYLTKPIKVKEFMDTLNVALEFGQPP